MCRSPACADADLDAQRHVEMDGGLRRFGHDAANDRRGGFGDALGRLEHEFVVDL